MRDALLLFIKYVINIMKKIGSLAKEISNNQPFLRLDITHVNSRSVPCGDILRSLDYEEIVIIVDERTLVYTNASCKKETWLKVITSDGIGWCPQKYFVSL